MLGAALLFERSGYHPKAPDPSALRQTGGRFRDPTTGQLVEVWEDPWTGVREYCPGAREELTIRDRGLVGLMSKRPLFRIRNGDS